MGSHGGLKRWPISQQQRAAMREAQAHVERVLQNGCPPDEQAQARAAIEAMREPRQPTLSLKVRQ